MSDEQPVRWEWRYAAGMLALGFNASVIMWLVLFGEGRARLHEMAMSWCFTLSLCILAGLGIGASIPDLGTIAGTLAGKKKEP